MLYQSTRDKNMLVKSAQAIKLGISPDGGLFVPQDKPKLSHDVFEKFSTMSYNARAIEVLKMFLTDFTLDEIKECVDQAYNKEKFETENIAPVYKLNDKIYFLELWHGPTCAFKDMALQILPHLLTKSIIKTGEDKEVVILVATSGDTGKAALEGFKDVKGTRIVVFYPENGVSEIQKLQMITQEGSNVGVAAVDGNFDDAQNGVKMIFTDNEYQALLEKNHFSLSSANSINWGRLVPQIIYYFSAYADLVKNEEIKLGEKINIVVPTGNFGNILAAYYAKEMGLPVNKLICASNENNVLTEFINKGVYDRKRNFKTTISPSMDILISSNLERLLFDITGNDDARVRQYMQELNEKGKYEVHDVTKEKISALFWAGYCNDEATSSAIKEIESEYSYVVDTHTAVGKNVYDQYVEATGDKTKTIIVSTASPFKFNHSVLTAFVDEEELKDKNEFELLDLLAVKSGQRIPKSLAQLKDKEKLHNIKCKKEEMKEVVNDILRLIKE
ncbi:threonine synthase [Petroclostridium sp. X23]|uniref:threonine synthase n=1 Tax=Petroclostridium sp. X23 TaxID=3045146 RepID=UPI0024AE1651|nr:threonine synthase [Petroclostridium sp. X23]WHH60260.1 threonine synthase [Petroclostridium sp. X23]